MEKCKKCKYHDRGECTTGVITSIGSLTYCSMYKPKRKDNANSKKS